MRLEEIYRATDFMFAWCEREWLNDHSSVCRSAFHISDPRFYKLLNRRVVLSDILGDWLYGDSDD